MDTIFIKELEIFSKIGVYEEEKKHAQPLIVDIDIYTCLRQASQTDNLSDAIDYTQLIRHIECVCQAKHRQLLESLAQDILDTLFEDNRIQAIRISITKPKAVKETRCLGISMHRERQK